MGVPEMHLFGHDHRLGGLRGPTVRRPTRSRQPIAEGAADHEDEIDRGHGEEGLPHAHRIRSLETVHQQIGEGSPDHGAPAKAHDGHARGHAAAVGKPFDERRNRRDVADSQSDAADDSQTQPHDPKLMLDHAKGGERHPAAPAEGGDDSRFARAGAFEPPAPGGGGNSQQHEEQRVDPDEIADPPVATRRDEGLEERHAGAFDGFVVAQRFGQRQPEDAESIGHADA